MTSEERQAPAGNEASGPASSGPDLADRLPKIDVVVVNWNTGAQAVRTARAYSSSEGVEARVIVVDNDSEPAERRLLEEDSGGGFELLAAGSNLGFGAGSNLGLASGSNRYVAVSNSDVLPEPDTLAKLVDAIDAIPEAGMAGPVFAGAGNIYHDHLPGPLTLIIRTAVGGFGRRKIPIPDEGQIAEVEQPSGACFVMRRETWGEVDGFDDGFFLWYEDVDLARRLIDAGKINLIVGGAIVKHAGGSSFELVAGPDQQAMRLQSLQRYLRLHHPWMARLSGPLFHLVGWARTHRPRT